MHWSPLESIVLGESGWTIDKGLQSDWDFTRWCSRAVQGGRQQSCNFAILIWLLSSKISIQLRLGKISIRLQQLASWWALLSHKSHTSNLHWLHYFSFCLNLQVQFISGCRGRLLQRYRVAPSIINLGTTELPIINPQKRDIEKVMLAQFFEINHCWTSSSELRREGIRFFGTLNLSPKFVKIHMLF